MADNDDNHKEGTPERGHVLSHRAYRDLRELESLREEYPKLLQWMIRGSAEKTSEIGDLQDRLDAAEVDAREAETSHQAIAAELQQRLSDEQAIRTKLQESLGAEQGLGKDLQAKLSEAQQRLTQAVAKPSAPASSNAGLAFFFGLVIGAIIVFAVLYFFGLLHRA